MSETDKDYYMAMACVCVITVAGAITASVGYYYNDATSMAFGSAAGLWGSIMVAYALIRQWMG